MPLVARLLLDNFEKLCVAYTRGVESAIDASAASARAAGLPAGRVVLTPGKAALKIRVSEQDVELGRATTRARQQAHRLATARANCRAAMERGAGQCCGQA